jgi:hypothetical protein
MPGTEQLQAAKPVSLPWTLLILSLCLLTFHMLWMWRRLGSGAPLVGIGLLIDAFVGIGLIIAGRKSRQKHDAQKAI